MRRDRSPRDDVDGGAMTATEAQALTKEFLRIAAEVKRAATTHMRATDHTIVDPAALGLKPTEVGRFALFCAHTEAMMIIHKALMKLADDVWLEVEEHL